MSEKLLYKNHSIGEVLAALSSIRINPIKDEYNLHDIIGKKLSQAGIAYLKEYQLAPRNRIDFLVSGGIGIEVKKGKPYSRQVIKQIERYAECAEISSIILVVERNLDMPKQVNGKKCYYFGLNKLWGIAL